MKVKNEKKYACFDYTDGCNGDHTKNIYQRGDVVIKPLYGYSSEENREPCNEIGVVLQVHDEFDLRTDMFGNESVSQLRMATMREVIDFRPLLAVEMGFGKVVLNEKFIG